MAYDAKEVIAGGGSVYVAGMDNGDVELTIVSPHGKAATVQLSSPELEDLIDTMNEEVNN